jgi:hypothetical protein
MKKLIGYLLAAVLCLFLGPTAFAQDHGNHNGGNHNGGHASGGNHGGGDRGGARNSGHASEQRGGHDARGGNNERGGHDVRGDRRTREEDRRHFDGRHFDRDFRGRWFGRGRGFRIGEPLFFGGCWNFWYGGFWFGYDVWPYGWMYTDPVYIDEDGGVYYLYNPYHPGYRVGLNIVF